MHLTEKQFVRARAVATELRQLGFEPGRALVAVRKVITGSPGLIDKDPWRFRKACLSEAHQATDQGEASAVLRATGDRMPRLLLP